MLLAKLHVLDGQYDEARLNEVSGAVTCRARSRSMSAARSSS